MSAQGISYQRPIGGSDATGAITYGGRRHRLARAPNMRGAVTLTRPWCSTYDQALSAAQRARAFRRARGRQAIARSPRDNRNPREHLASNLLRCEVGRPMEGAPHSRSGGGTARPSAVAAAKQGWRRGSMARPRERQSSQGRVHVHPCLPLGAHPCYPH